MTESTEVACYAVQRLGIPEVMDGVTGEILPVPLVLTAEYGEVVKMRTRVSTGLKQNQPNYRCPTCGSSVRLICMRVRRLFYFQHTENHSDCPWHTKTHLTREEILARQYNGAKESEAHQFMKMVLRESLALDPLFSGSPIDPEKVWKGKFGDWRKPDVTAQVNSLKVAFEVQLSTTFLDVIVSRREFYLGEAALLLWVFRDIDLDKRRLTVEDVFYPNNRNAFIASQHTLDESRRQGRVVLKCRWLEPVERDGKVFDEWHHAYVGWSDLTVDLATQRVFHFDYDAARATVELALADRRKIEIRERFECFWISGRESRSSGLDWARLRADFSTLGIELPQSHFASGFASLFDQLFSARKGRPVGYRYDKLLQVAHLVNDRHPHNLWWFGQMLKRHDTDKILEGEDASGKWKNRRDMIRGRMRVGDTAYAPDMAYIDAIRMIFPEMEDCPAYPGKFMPR